MAPMRSLSMTILIGCLGCGTSAAPPADVPQAADEPALDPEAQALVERLNGWCASYPDECVLFEFPDSSPDRASTGETNGFLGDAKQRLEALGVTCVFDRSTARYGDCRSAVGQPSDPLRCRDDADCSVTSFDCSECGRCPGDPARAVTAAGLATAMEECERNPPVRNNPQAAAMGLTVPACQPCDGGLIQEFVTLYRAVCRDGSCIAEPYATEPVPPPSDVISPPDTPGPTP
jgi:hypothetical protein